MRIHEYMILKIYLHLHMQKQKKSLHAKTDQMDEFGKYEQGGVQSSLSKLAGASNIQIKKGAVNKILGDHLV